MGSVVVFEKGGGGWAEWMERIERRRKKRGEVV